MIQAYRPDIDGLRAIAVLAIVAFHLDLKLFPGGYVGVDIFFVISGFLITTILLKEMATDSFSLQRFYERRVRRIAPALAVTMLLTLGLGAVLLHAEARTELGQSAMATAVFASNFHFFFGSGYFDGPSHYKPLLHTWSLAVEEQFYILFPLLLMVLSARMAHAVRHWLFWLGIASFIGGALMTHLNPTAAFYLLPFRAWELLLGALVALRFVPAPISPFMRELLAAAGLALMLASVFLFTPETAFPGVAALAPTLGAALIIHAGLGGDSLVKRGLSLRPLVVVGLISYSLYLWHWPIIVYSRQILLNTPTRGETLALLALTLLAGFLSWRFVEQPFRQQRQFWNPRRLFQTAGFSGLAVIAAGLGLGQLHDREDIAHGIAPELRAAVRADPGWEHWKTCEDMSERSGPLMLCALGVVGAPDSFLLWGDSHAMALASGVNRAAAEAGTAGRLAIRTACQPLLGVERPGRRSCEAFNQAVMRWLEQRPEVSTVIIAARWALLTESSRYKEETGDVILLEATSGDLKADMALGVERNRSLLSAGLASSIEAVRALGREAALVAQVPEIGRDITVANHIGRLTGKDASLIVAPTRAEFEQRTAAARAILADIAAGHHVPVLDAGDILCGGERCRVLEAGVPLYRDDNHLSTLGSVLISPIFLESVSDR